MLPTPQPGRRRTCDCRGAQCAQRRSRFPGRVGAFARSAETSPRKQVILLFPSKSQLKCSPGLGEVGVAVSAPQRRRDNVVPPSGLKVVIRAVSHSRREPQCCPPAWRRAKCKRGFNYPAPQLGKLPRNRGLAGQLSLGLWRLTPACLITVWAQRKRREGRARSFEALNLPSGSCKPTAVWDGVRDRALDAGLQNSPAVTNGPGARGRENCQPGSRALSCSMKGSR